MNIPTPTIDECIQELWDIGYLSEQDPFSKIKEKYIRFYHSTGAIGFVLSDDGSRMVLEI